MLCGILYQFFDRHYALLRTYAEPNITKYGKELQNQFHELWKVLSLVTSIKVNSNTVLVSDALDEYKRVCRRILAAELEDYLLEALDMKREY